MKNSSISPETQLGEIEQLLSIDHRQNHSVEEVLEKVIRYYETIIGCMPGNVYWLDKEGRAVGCNKNVLNMFGLDSIDEFKGLSFDEMRTIGRWSDDAAQSFKKDTLEVIATGLPKLNIEEPPIPHSDGRIIHFLTHRVPLFDDKKEIIGVVGISIDITERKQLEQALKEAKERAEAANQSKNEFMENMRHDIRTPLTGIVGFADLLKMEPDSNNVQEYAENLVASSHALLELLDEVLEAVRVSSGEIPKLKKKFNLFEVLEHVIRLNRAKAAQKKLSLSMHFDSSLPKYVIGDKVRLHRVALELLANALNFTDKGFVKLSVCLAKCDEQKLVIKLTVEDSGIGIPKDKQEEIYVQFKRLTPSYQGIYKGAGLGLAVVKQFIDELNGEIYVESEPLKGTCFTCFIPLQKPLLEDEFGVDSTFGAMIDRANETTYAQQIKSAVTTNHRFRVLVVEDNAIAQTAARSILSKLNCEAEIAESGRAAIDLWKDDHYDVILMDIGLPDLDGYEVTHQIRVQELAKKTHVPIIALTAHVGDESKKRCIEAGMNAVLSKPLTIKNCEDMLDTFIPGRRSKAETLAEKQNNISTLNPQEHWFQLSEFPLLDIEEGLKTLNDIDSLSEMLKFMLSESLPVDTEQLVLAHQQGNWDKTQQLIHKIKGGAVYVGTTQLKMACQYFDQYWKSGERELLEPLYQHVLTIIENSKDAISDWLNKNFLPNT
ncbi:response regulator [Legionella genomosp. 1]|uniref:response regulator n=1 Tax=Legionella genomosp. 1 TaxID=1093625 RepID=UPI001055BEA5|nr:response regulator [Legionella genomosp. 1]